MEVPYLLYETIFHINVSIERLVIVNYSPSFNEETITL